MDKLDYSEKLSPSASSKSAESKQDVPDRRIKPILSVKQKPSFTTLSLGIVFTVLINLVLANNVQAVKPAKHPELVMADVPPADYYVLPAIGRKPDSSVRLKILSAKSNQITDHEEWWIANGLKSLTYQVRNQWMRIKGNTPDIIPESYQNAMLVKVIKGNPLLAIYGANFTDGRYLLAIDPNNGQALFAMDFNLYLWPKSFKKRDQLFVSMQTRWAQVVGRTLYVSHSHATYAKSSNGYNAYITAIDIPSNRILWRSAPLVSNVNNFLIKDDAIISGYGFTAEKDYMYVLNKADGRVVQKLLIKSGPDYIVEKDNRLYVRTYNTDYVFGYE